MEANVATAITAIALGSTNAMLHLLARLAAQGLVDAKDVDNIAHSLTAPLDELADDPAAAKLRSVLETTLSPVLAEIHELARQREGRP